MSDSDSHTHKSRMAYYVLMGSYLVLGMVISFISLRQFAIPYFWIALVWWPLLLHLTLVSANKSVQVVFFNLVTIVAILGLFELVLSDEIMGAFNPPKTVRVEIAGTPNPDFVRRHDVLGYAPNKDNAVTRKETYSDGGSLEVRYTIDGDGLRISGTEEGRGYEGSVLFFGGSVTFGEAVDDRETVPYRVGKKLGRAYRIYNFGFEGYGPHQMLAALQHDDLRKIVEYEPQYVVYQVIMDHINRVIRGHPWIKYGPRYRLDNGDLIRDGFFDDAETTRVFGLKKVLKKSSIAKKMIIARSILNKKVNAGDNIELFVRIVEESCDLAGAMYPESEFHVVFWDPEDPRYATHYDTGRVVDELRQRGLNLHLMSDIIPDYGARPEKYVAKYNGHPNGLAYKMVSDYLVDAVIAEVE